MKTLVVLMIAVVIWLAGINGNFGSILAAIIDPGSLVEGSNSAGQDFNTPASQAAANNPPSTTGAGANF